jgi:hypothetical protein
MVSKKTFIYSDTVLPVLFCINRALLKCVEFQGQNEKLTAENPALIECFLPLKESSFDSHIKEGLFKRHQERDKVFPRILKLTLNAFKDANEIKVKSGYI